MKHDFPKEPEAKRAMLLDAVAAIGPILSASGPNSEELGTLAPDAVTACATPGCSSSSSRRKWAAPKPIR